MAPERQRRRKVTLACEPCRYRKSRCDGGKPICSTCRNRSLGLEQCIYTAANSRTACTDDYTRSLHERIRELEQACSAQQKETPAPAPCTHTQPQMRELTEQLATGQTSSPSLTLGSEIARDQGKTPSASPHDENDLHETASGVTAMGTMLSEDVLNGSVERSQNFYGGSSAVSFLKEACGPIGPQSPNNPPQVREQQPRDVLSAYSNLAKYPLPPRAVADHLIQKYFERVYYLYPFFDREAFDSAYQCLWQSGNEAGTDPKLYHGLGLGSSPGADSSSNVFHCALNAIFALGCTFSDLNASEKPAAMYLFFRRSKCHVGIDLLDMNNVGVVQALLLIALVLQGTPFPNRCWNAVGVACRVAQGLGLHADGSHQSGESREKQVRRQTWYGCVIMDMLVSLTFGRPNMTTNLPAPPSTASADGMSSLNSEPEQLKFQFNIQSVHLGRILEGILSKVYKPWLHQSPANEKSSTLGSDIHYSLDNIVEIHTQLTRFEQSLPPSLSWKYPVLFETFTQEDQLILKTQRIVLHARFLYLQLVLHRPVLTRLLTADTTGDSTSEAVDTTGMHSLKNGLIESFDIQCAKSYIEASVKLIEMVRDTHQTDASDMWWWNGLYACTAGLVLIISRLYPPLWNSLDETEISKSWEQCQTVLRNLASFSTSGRKSINVLLKVNEFVLAKQAAKKRGVEKLPEAVVDTQALPPPGDQGSPKEFFEQGFPFNLDILDVDQMDIVGSFFPTWDQTLESMPSDFY